MYNAMMPPEYLHEVAFPKLLGPTLSALCFYFLTITTSIMSIMFRIVAS